MSNHLDKETVLRNAKASCKQDPMPNESAKDRALERVRKLKAEQGAA